MGSPCWLDQAAYLWGGHRVPSEASVGCWGQHQCGDCEHRAAMRKCSGSSMRPTEVGDSLHWQPEAKETVSLGKPISSGKHTAQHTHGGAGCVASASRCGLPGTLSPGLSFLFPDLHNSLTSLPPFLGTELHWLHLGKCVCFALSAGKLGSTMWMQRVLEWEQAVSHWKRPHAFLCLTV